MFGVKRQTIYCHSKRMGLQIRKQEKRKRKDCSQEDIAAAMDKVKSGKYEQMKTKHVLNNITQHLPVLSNNWYSSARNGSGRGKQNVWP